MKTLSLFAFGLLTLATIAPAFADDTSDTCGLGWQVTNKQTLLGTSTRGTTNNFVPVSTFAMTSGTSGCTKHSIVKKDQPAVEYVASNLEPLKLDMAAGHGEYVDALARSMGCGGVSDAFGRMTQQKYRSIIEAGKTPYDFFEQVRQELRANPILASGCNA